MSSFKWPFCLDFAGWSGLRVLDVNGLKRKDHVEVHHHEEALGDNVLPNLNISVAFLVNCWALVTSLRDSEKFHECIFYLGTDIVSYVHHLNKPDLVLRNHLGDFTNDLGPHC